MQRFPLVAPNPPALSAHIAALRRIEASGIFSNNGPEVCAFEAEVTAQMFGGHGASLAVANATLGLMIAIRHAAHEAGRAGGMALMPALTFAATAQAAAWAGLTPLICDIDPTDWAACATAEERLLAERGDQIGVIVPYATFGTAIDLDRYAWLQRRHGVGIVIDAASSLGTLDAAGSGFGHDAPFAIVYSMHATKTFAVAEGGLIHSGDAALIASLRAMTNFGFTAGRSATLLGLNAKLPEILALAARAKLAEIHAVCDHRATIAAEYRAVLGRDFALQAMQGRRQAMQFMPVLLPPTLAARRTVIMAAMDAESIGTGCYFSPHIGQQPLFRDIAEIAPTPLADAIAGRMLSLPITDRMRTEDARHIATTFAAICAREAERIPASPRGRAIVSTVIIGGGPAGTALLTAASKQDALADLARSGLVIVERDAAIGGGRLGDYAINSDSSAQTFLSAVKDNPYPCLAGIAAHRSGRAVASYADALGVPLVVAGPLLRETGARLAEIVADHGGSVLTGHDAVQAQRTADGLWRTRLRRRCDGAVFDQLSYNIVVATGGHQPLDRLAAQSVAGAALLDQAAGKLVQSDAMLSLGGPALVGDLLGGKRAPKIAVIGGSTSALTTIALLLKGSLPFGANAITLLHRRPLRPFYPSVAAAQAEGFTDFGPADICPVSGFVYRLAGFRLEARELVLRMLGVDGRTPDPRIATHRIDGDDDAVARAHIAAADLVVAALGYRPHGFDLRDVQDAPIALAAHRGAPMVDGHCRILDDAGQPIAGLYGIGLAAGFVPWGRLGGEASFAGQANGLWLWQNDVGQMIVDQLLGERARPQVRAQVWPQVRAVA